MGTMGDNRSEATEAPRSKIARITITPGHGETQDATNPAKRSSRSPVRKIRIEAPFGKIRPREGVTQYENGLRSSDGYDTAHSVSRKEFQFDRKTARCRGCRICAGIPVKGFKVADSEAASQASAGVRTGSNPELTNQTKH